MFLLSLGRPGNLRVFSVSNFLTEKLAKISLGRKKTLSGYKRRLVDWKWDYQKDELFKNLSSCVLLGMFIRGQIMGLKISGVKEK